MPDLPNLLAVLEQTRALLAAPNNDFSWSSWEDATDALAEVDALLAQLRSGAAPNALALTILFAPTGPMQEVSLSSGWGDDFIELARRFDIAMASVGSP